MRTRSLTLYLLIGNSILITLLIIYNAQRKDCLNKTVDRLIASDYQRELKRPRICCLILTYPGNFLSKAKAVNDTWGPRCDKYFFISEFLNQNFTKAQKRILHHLPFAPLPDIKAGYIHLLQKTTLALLFAYRHYYHDFDWFVKLDDDTYLIVENLKAFLREKNTNEPVTYGFKIKVRLYHCEF